MSPNALLETHDKLEAKGRAIQQFRDWLLHDQYLVQTAMEQIVQGTEASALATLRALESEIVEQRES
jgi:hypothetical protein